jgi:muramoyltetrapeptide carboxypeptidase
VDAARSPFKRRIIGRVKIVPPPLAPGDAVRVIAPSGPCAAADLWPGLAWVRSRYRLKMAPGVLARDGYLAGPDSRRRDELLQALSDETVGAILAVRGGYGAMRIVEHDQAWKAFRERPKWIVGFSDVTVLHAMAWRLGVASIHGPNAAGLRWAGPCERRAWLSALETPGAARRWQGLDVHVAGRAAGLLVGGNLSLLHALAAAGRLSVPAGAVVAFEEVNEAPYRIDRMLTSLLLGRHLDTASAFVVGGLQPSAGVAGGPSAEDVVVERLRPLGVPLLMGAPFGHEAPNEAFILGVPVTVEGSSITWDG